jgi:hypothetical protein
MAKHKKKKLSAPAVAKKHKAIKAAKKSKLDEMIAAAKAKIIAGMSAKKAAAKAAFHKKVTTPHTKRSFGWKASDHPAISIEKLRKISTNKLEFILFQAWKGYRIAHGQGDKEKLKYYAEGIDKVTAELEGRPDITDRQRRELKKHAVLKDTHKLPHRLPRYADGLWLKEGASSKVTIIAPIAFFKPK